jgi:hypothetical protein
MVSGSIKILGSIQRIGESNKCATLRKLKRYNPSKHPCQISESQATHMENMERISKKAVEREAKSFVKKCYESG